MNENKRVYNFNYGGKEFSIETGRLAKQANGAVLVSCGSTQVLVTVCASDSLKDGQDFFPLTVDYNEKFYAAGKFLGGFSKRESKPTTQETLCARLIDRPLRPLFPEGFMFETFVQATVISYGPDGDPEVCASLGAPAALAISDIPFGGPLGTCKVGRIDGQLVLNPNYSQWQESDLELVVSGTSDAIMMVEGEGREISEAEMLGALEFAHKNIKGFLPVIEKMQKEVGKAKRPFEPVTPNKKLMDGVRNKFSNQGRAALEVKPKLERQDSVKALIASVKSSLEQEPGSFGLEDNVSFGKEAAKAVDQLLYEMMRKDIVENGKRIGGRKLNEVRSIETEIDILKTPHGSSLFTRGETQVMATVTLGGKTGEQMADRIHGLNYERFYLHYAFPPFSVGEARGVFKVGRRELGHGNLAERAIRKVLPPHDKFNYTIRVMCEVLESNGSSSMASVCSGSMALMDASVPLKAPVAGIAMGLVKEGEKYQILSDILGDEDHLGDMDFKLAGTVNGITAIQMDMKIAGITMEIFRKALDQAKEGRLHILGEMAKTIATPRKELKASAPKIEHIKIDPDKIGLLIGPGGKNVKGIQEKYKVTLEVDEAGVVRVSGGPGSDIVSALKHVELQINGPEVGHDYDGEVVAVKEYGAFVDIGSGLTGLLHVSELSDTRVEDVQEYLKEGLRIKVRVLEVDRFGKLKLSAKAVSPLKKLNS